MGLIKAVVGLLLIGFALLDIIPKFKNISFGRKYLSLGGFISGFMGGLTGIQGALRSAFLIKTGLSKEAFIGSGTVSAVIVDIARLIVYGFAFYTMKFEAISNNLYGLVAAAAAAAFIGSFIGVRLVKKVTFRVIQLIVGSMIILVGIGIILGLI